MITGEFQTIFDMDFTTHGTQTFATDGNYTIGGYPFIKQNSSYDRLATTLDSNGLTFAPSQSSDWNTVANTRSLPFLCVKLKDMSSRFNLARMIRVWFHNPNNTAAAGYECTVVAIGNSSNNFSFIHKRGYGISGVGMSPTINTLGNTYNDYPTALNTTNDVIIMDIPCVFEPRYATYFGGMTNGNWPDVKNVTLCSWYDRGGDLSVANITALTLADFSVCLGSQRAGSGNLYTSVFKRLRVDIY